MNWEKKNQRIGIALIFLAIVSCSPQKILPSNPPCVLRVIETKIEVQGKKAPIFRLVQEEGTFGFFGKKGERFHVRVQNETQVPTSIHWHGILLPNGQDGVPFVTQAPIPPGESMTYNYPLLQKGTYWMHSHYGLQEQALMTAPLILRDSSASSMRELVILLNDFTFQNPREIFHNLQAGQKPHNSQNGSMAPSAMSMDLTDVNYDAFLANQRTLNDPEIFQVQPGEKLRLRIINGSSSSNFWIELGTLPANAVAVDGEAILPLPVEKWELAVAQRVDFIVQIPDQPGAYPLLFPGEGTTMQAGILLVTPHAVLPQLSDQREKKAPAFTMEQEQLLQPVTPLSEHPINRQLTAILGGDMNNYHWTINGKAWPDPSPLIVQEGERVEINIINQTSMAHPMHLHGHVFQVTEINGQSLNGAKRDTVLVPAQGNVTIEFDANAPGVWAFHCHLLYHLAAGMLTVVQYEGYHQPNYQPQASTQEISRSFPFTWWPSTPSLNSPQHSP